MARFLWKPESEKDGNLVILTDVPYDTLIIRDDQGNVIQGTNTGPSNGYGATIRFDSPGASFNNVQVLTPNGDVVQTISTGNDRAELQDVSPSAANVQPGQFATADGRFRPGANLEFGIAAPIQANLGLLTENLVNFDPIEGTPPVDIFGIAGQAGEFNKDIILQSFDDSRGITDQILADNDESNKVRLSEINEFNAAEQAKAFATLGPDAANAINQGIRNLSAFSEGRLPDALENEILNQSTRALQAQQTNITGGGISSSFGQRVANQLSIQQRLGLQQNALNATPSFLANALEIRRGTPQKLVFNPNERNQLLTGVAGQLSSAQTLSPSTAIQGAFNNVANELNTQRFNATNEFAESQANSAIRTAFQNNLLQLDLFNQREIQNFEQQVFNAPKIEAAQQQSQDLANQNADAQQQANQIIAEGQATGDTIAATGQVIGAGLDILETTGVIGGDEDTGAGTGTTGTSTGTTTTTDAGLDTTAPTVIVEDNSAPQSPAPVGSSGETVIQPSDPVASTTLPDGSAGVILDDGSTVPSIEVEIEDFDTADISTEDSINMRAARIDIPNSQLRSSVSTPTFVNTRQLQANTTARANVAQSVNTADLSPTQVQYNDGTDGFQPEKPLTQLSEFRGPIPSAIYPDVSTDRGEQVSRNTRNFVSASNAPGLVSKPVIGATEYNPLSPDKNNLMYSPIRPAETQISDLGSDAFDTIMDQISSIPMMSGLLETASGDVELDPLRYVDIAVDNALNDLGEV